MAAACDMVVHLPLQRELYPFNLSMVTSTAIQMVFGNTVVIALMEARNLTKEEYIANHPAGKIGKSLIFKVFLFLFLCICICFPLIGCLIRIWITSKGCVKETGQPSDLQRIRFDFRNPRIISPEAIAVER